jgi:hypothetical protein
MTESTAVLVPALAVLITLGACGGGARDVDYRPSRGISSDIDATHASGSTSFMKGRTTYVEPLGDMPWLTDERHQGGP